MLSNKREAGVVAKFNSRDHMKEFLEALSIAIEYINTSSRHSKRGERVGDMQVKFATSMDNILCGDTLILRMNYDDWKMSIDSHHSSIMSTKNFKKMKKIDKVETYCSVIEALFITQQ